MLAAAALSRAAPAHAHNSLLPAEGFRIAAITSLRRHDDDPKKWAVAKSAHFRIQTTLGKDAAELIVKHLEAWHAQLVKALPGYDALVADRYGGTPPPVRMRVFAHPIEKGAWLCTDKEHPWNDTSGVVCTANPKDERLRVVPVTALQHEVFHYWNGWNAGHARAWGGSEPGGYFGRSIPDALEEGSSDFFAYFDIDRTVEENLRGFENDPFIWDFARRTIGGEKDGGNLRWLSVRELLEDRKPPGSYLYQQGWWFFRFLLSDAGAKHRDVVLSAYRIDAEAQRILRLEENRERVREAFRDVTVPIRGRKDERGEHVLDVPFSDAYVEELDAAQRAFVVAEIARWKARAGAPAGK